ncbi:MAG TPA: hypothetical protein VNF69_15000 [Burkholderiales bacterium]|nr:hypothetical protein [Burkholderiales bacterium]
MRCARWARSGREADAFEAIAAALHEAGVRYLVARGLAVNAHGYVRLTYDVDLVVQLEPENIMSAFAALAGLGYRPTVRVTAEQFASPARSARAGFATKACRC